MIEYQQLGTVEYRAALKLQQELVRKRIAGEIADRILFLEHPPVVTQGKRECPEDFRSSPEEIKRSGIDIVRIDRGGRLTYHGPGQLIGYFICDVTIAGGVREFVRAIEELLIRTLGDFGITAGRDPDHPGVWVDGAKIAAIGLHVAHNVASHGFALNVSCDLEPYDHIVACGIQDKGVTSMRKLTRGAISVDDVVQSVVVNAGEVLRRVIRQLQSEQR